MEPALVAPPLAEEERSGAGLVFENHVEAAQVGPSPPFTPQRTLRRLAVPKLSPAANLDELLGTEAPGLLEAFSDQVLPARSEKVVPLLEDEKDSKQVGTVNTNKRHALTPSKRQNIASPAKNDVGGIKSGRKSARKSGKKPGEEETLGCGGSECIRDGQRRISSYFSPSPAKSSQTSAGNIPLNGAVGRQLFAEGVQLAGQVSQTSWQANALSGLLHPEGGSLCKGLEEQRDCSVPGANAALIGSLDGPICKETAELGGDLTGVQEEGVDSTLTMPQGCLKEPEVLEEEKQPACDKEGDLLVETHSMPLVNNGDQTLQVLQERAGMKHNQIMGASINHRTAVVPARVIIESAPIPVISGQPADTSSEQHADRSVLSAANNAQAVELESQIDVRPQPGIDSIQRAPAQGASAETQANADASSLEPSSHSDLHKVLTTDTIEEMSAALLADIEDLPTTVPFESESQEPLEASPSPEKPSTEQADLHTRAERVGKMVEEKRTIEQTVFENVGTSERDAEVQRRERLVERRRRGRMAVTDLCALEWCEMQVDFSAKVGKPAPTPVMQAGTARHEQLEREVITRVEVPVTTREDAWALKLLNMITGLRQLMHEGMTRELYIFGLLEGHWVVGVIDELRLTERDGRFGPLLCDTKTRRSLKPPSEAQKRNGMLQLMCYKLLFDQLVWESRFPVDAFFAHFHVRARAPLSADVVVHAAAECNLHVAVLEDVLEALTTECRFFPRAHDTLLLRYEWQERRTVWAEEEFNFSEKWTRERMAWHLKYWFGVRPPEVVQIEERWKCNHCAFRDTCEVGQLVARSNGEKRT